MNTQQFLRVLCVAAMMATTANGMGWTSFYKGNEKYFAQYDSTWVMLDASEASAPKLSEELERLMPANVVQILWVEPTRAVVQVKRVTDWDNVILRLRKRGLANRYWLSLKRGDGIALFDDQIVVKSSVKLPQRTLKRMGVNCHRAQYIDSIYLCRVDDSDVLATTRALHRLSEVIWAEPNFLKLMSLYERPKDPLLSAQWHLDNAEGVAHINAFEAWQQTTGDPSIVIAIVDSGMDLGHPDLEPNLVGGFDALGNDDDPSPECGSQPDGQGPAPSCPSSRPYRDSHGTAVAGVAAGASNTIFGTGVCPDCSIFAVRLIGDSGGVRSLSSAQTFSRLTQAGVAVVNNSWGPSISQFFPLSQIEDEALTELTTVGGGGAGAVVLFAAGNDYFQSADYNPYTSHPGVITIAASTRRDDFACYSNLGRSISLAAPSQGCFEGEDGLLTTDVRGDEGYSNTAVTSDFGGTSAASPVAAGVAGLVLSAAPQLSAEAVRLVLEQTAEKIQTKTDWTQIVGRDISQDMAYDKYGFSPFFGYGRVDAGRAVSMALSLDGNRLFDSCDKDCGYCENGLCLGTCEDDLDCPTSQRCDVQEGGQKACRRPRRDPGDVGAFCGPECSVCATTYALDFRQVSLCSKTCSGDAECPVGFDCRRVDEEAQICVPGPKSCGDSWSNACETRVQVGPDSSPVCSCDCIEGTTGACPESMTCANAFCTYRRGRISCQPVDSQFQANDMPKCFPQVTQSTTCTDHMDCSYGLYCIDGTCQVDSEGCDTCAECIRQSDCAEGSQCVNTQRGRRCLRACDSDDACASGTHCVPLPTVGQRYCINADSDRKGVCPRAWKCPLGDRCLLESDCPDGCTCSGDNVCDCSAIETPDMGPPETVDAMINIDFPSGNETKENASGCTTLSSRPAPLFAIWMFSLLALFGRRYRLNRPLRADIEQP